MFDNCYEFWEGLSNAVILVDDSGKVIYKNAAGHKLLKMFKVDECGSIKIVDPDFNPKSYVSGNRVSKTIIYNKTQLHTKIYTKKYDVNKTGFLYVLDDSYITSMKIDEIINCIDDIIVIFDKCGTFENVSKKTAEVLEYDNQIYTPEVFVGENVDCLVEWGITNNPITHDVLKTKKQIKKRVVYSSGKTITYTATPLFDQDGDIDKVILTGRDISRLVELEAQLKKSEILNKQYNELLKELEIYQGLNEIIYSSKNMDKLVKVAVRVAKTDSSVFITGESGVGKEVIAKLIHKNSKRKDKPFIAINCAAIPSELLEAEFFGYEEGAFTGAKKGGKKGIFEEANGGTLFLDEIGELPLQMQSKLLRAIQENGFMKIGSSRFSETDIRYISATNLSKEELSDNHKFRQDLYYRLGVVPIMVPALRERKDDVLPLVHHFLKSFNNKYERSVKISKEVLENLYNYNWPGNIRELKNVIERLVILADDDLVGREELSMVTQLGEDNDENSVDIAIDGLMKLEEAYKIVDEILIERALKEQGSIINAAKVLGIDPSTIHRKIKKGLNIK